MADLETTSPHGPRSVANGGEGVASALHFTAVIELRDINPYVLVTREQAAALRPGWKKPMPVLVQVNGQPREPWRINMMPVGDGSFYLYLHGDVRKASGTGVGDVVTVAVTFDEQYQNGPMHPMPEWFKRALHECPEAQKHWETLIPSRQKEVLRYFSSLRSAEARARNVERALYVLSGQPGRFMGRSWDKGR